jgi:hypothetical protein
MNETSRYVQQLKNSRRNILYKWSRVNKRHPITALERKRMNKWYKKFFRRLVNAMVLNSVVT